MNDKYVVFKRSAYDDWSTHRGASLLRTMPQEIDDAVVIRRQDMFAASALDTYADSITVAISVINMCSEDNANGTIGRLRQIADYFREQAELARDTNTKVPD